MGSSLVAESHPLPCSSSGSRLQTNKQCVVVLIQLQLVFDAEVIELVL